MSQNKLLKPIVMAWNNDERANHDFDEDDKKNPDYFDPTNMREFRLNVFLRGYELYLSGKTGDSVKDRVTWYRVGMYEASIHGDIPEHIRWRLYLTQLATYLFSSGRITWDMNTRQEALSIAIDEVQRREAEQI